LQVFYIISFIQDANDIIIIAAKRAQKEEATQFEDFSEEAKAAPMEDSKALMRTQSQSQMEIEEVTSRNEPQDEIERRLSPVER
jgi:hypothetical protein